MTDNFKEWNEVNNSINWISEENDDNDKKDKELLTLSKKKTRKNVKQIQVKTNFHEEMSTAEEYLSKVIQGINKDLRRKEIIVK